jgi:ribosome biogenesis protein BMS1
MPRVMGVLTHLDMLKNNKQLKKTKKTLKHRFWTEVYAGAKLFYLSGLLHGEYLRNEVKNLGRFISVMKFRPLTWRTTHPFIVGMSGFSTTFSHSLFLSTMYNCNCHFH